MIKLFKNIDVKKTLFLKDEISYQSGQVLSKTLTQNDKLSITLFSLDKNEEIATHKAAGDALVIILAGTAIVTIDESNFLLDEGMAILMPHDHPHSLFAKDKFKMLLIISY